MRAGDRFAEWMSCRIGSPLSIFLHTATFVACFEAWLLGEVRLEDMLLWLTTIVSLETIYIGLFLQNSANRHGGTNEHQAAEDFRSDAVPACRQSALRRVLIESLAHRRAKKAAIACTRLLAEHGIEGGESGVAGLAGCLLVSSDPEARGRLA